MDCHMLQEDDSDEIISLFEKKDSSSIHKELEFVKLIPNANDPLDFVDAINDVLSENV